MRTRNRVYGVYEKEGKGHTSIDNVGFTSIDV
jgi:hypothetical protein